MKKKFLPFVFDDRATLFHYGDDFFLVEKGPVQWVSHPVKVPYVMAVICVRGKIKGTHNLVAFEAAASSLLVLLVDHTVTIEKVSRDFSGRFIILSKKFVEALQVEERLPAFLSIHQNPLIRLQAPELASLKNYFAISKRVIRNTRNPFIEKVLHHFTKAFFYGFGYQAHGLEKVSAADKQPRQEELVQRFLADLQDHFRTERNISFYADRLNVTPKYLSKVIKDHNGSSAKAWIESYVMTEAKALLKSTDRTIQQISDELNFPTQSFFGKFFKRSAGLSPLEYRKSSF